MHRFIETFVIAGIVCAIINVPAAHYIGLLDLYGVELILGYTALEAAIASYFFTDN